MPATQTVVRWIAFAGADRIASGAPAEVATLVKTYIDSHTEATALVFDAVTSQPVELDLRGSLGEVLARLGQATAALDRRGEGADEAPLRRPGRPRLGVTAREVTLLPRHWGWLASQPGGSSVTLRKLVEQSMRANRDQDRARQARDATYRFIHALAGNEAGYEEATRALFAGDYDRFHLATVGWPAAVRDHALNLARTATAPLPTTVAVDSGQVDVGEA